MKKFLRKFIGNQNPFLLFYHRVRAMVAALMYGFPARKMRVIGVTGTNGKTTTVNMITNLLTSAGYKVGMLSSINFQVGDERWENKTKMSSQSPFRTQKLLSDMAKAGCDFAVVEVTSHAVVQSRIWGINFDVGVFTNISNDHLDYHGGFMNYMHAKGAFFDRIQGSKRKRGVDKVLVINNDDAQFDYFGSFSADRKYTYGLDKGSIKAIDLQLDPAGTKFTVKAPNFEFEVSMKMIGDFNVYNALAAAAVVISQGLTPEQVTAGFAQMEPIPGRYEPVEVGQPYSVIVDYAHTEDALEKLCMIFKGLTEGNLTLVFGCTGGGRDKAKRPKMGAIADRYADLIVLTNDDPYTENEMAILEDIAEGIDRREGEGLVLLVDRRSAIEYALEQAQEGDTVLLAGKGCEQVIVLGTEFVPWDDREVVREILSREHVINVE